MKVRRIPGGLIKTKCDREGHKFYGHSIAYDPALGVHRRLYICQRCGHRKVEDVGPWDLPEQLRGRNYAL